MAPQEQLRKATVILNPAACNGKANNLFEKNAAPILHLAGVEITLVKTDYEGQAKKLMELLEHTDMLIVAGGDGTMQEVITGLLRRPDQEKMSGIPIGFIPLGSTNSLSPSLHLLNDNKVKDITSATLSILRGVTVPLDVLQIKGEKDQPVFALMGLQWGAFRDAASKISKYWYLGPLKTYAAHWFSTLREWPLVRDISISHLAPTLRPPDQPFEKPPRPSLLYRIARRLKNYWNPPIEEPPKLEEPEQWKEEKLSTLELLVQTHNNNPVERASLKKYIYIYNHVAVLIKTETLTFYKFFKLQRINDSLVIHAEPDNFSVADFITVGNAKTKDPIIFSKNSTILEASACRLQLPEGAGGFYNIDNEEYEAMPVEVRLLPRKLRFFISAERRAQFLSLTQGEKDIKNDNSTETT
ncbi:acylglycerol kinase, mitochondrial isoform X3 [Takifugu flavidus]|nr:acylglycerol kinase, mitochondrial isoform X3 [Takifugu flavidus]